eukprot:gene9180-1472_t
MAAFSHKDVQETYPEFRKCDPKACSLDLNNINLSVKCGWDLIYRCSRYTSKIAFVVSVVEIMISCTITMQKSKSSQQRLTEIISAATPNDR